ncbi:MULTISPECIES: LPP20 family lipoprotein [unclassified Helicobacter]|uniref:LPP20 family lipoprotein n=1 Tax=unclassified Helicobacter TaxID=2593540 RepID=UPI000CF19F81|nr:MULTISPECIES: LPP20 family lipoprotein [unclassified Helicobacter]
MRQIFFALLFFGVGLCATPPKWFLQNQIGKDWFVGVGSGNNAKSAKLEAFSDLASMISVEVDSTFSLNKQRVGNIFSDNARSAIQLKVEDLKLLDINILNSEIIDGIYYVQVGIKKAKVLDQIHNEILKELEKTSLEYYEKCNFLDLKSFKSLQGVLRQLDSKVKIFDALSQEKFTNQKLEKFVEIYSKNLPKPQANLIYENLDLNLQDSLSKEFLKFVALTPEKLNRASSILVQGKDLDGKNIINLMILDCQGIVIFQEKFEFDASSLKRANFIIFKAIKKWIEE